MPSTGLAAFTLTRLQMMTAVLLALRVKMPGVALSTDEISQMNIELNMMLKEWAVKGLKLWCYQQVLVPLVANQSVYTIGPTGANVTAVRPLRVFENGNFLRQMNSGQPYDMPLKLIARSDYAEFGSKGSTGVPNTIYYQPGIDLASGATSPSTGYGTLYVYVTPSAPTLPRTVYLNAQRPIYDMNSDTDEFDLPSEWFNAIKAGMMYRMADYFEVSEDRQARLSMKADSALAACSDWSTEEAPTQIVPDYSTLSRSRFRR